MRPPGPIESNDWRTWDLGSTREPVFSLALVTALLRGGGGLAARTARRPKHLPGYPDTNPGRLSGFSALEKLFFKSRQNSGLIVGIKVI